MCNEDGVVARVGRDVSGLDVFGRAVDDLDHADRLKSAEELADVPVLGDLGGPSLERQALVAGQLDAALVAAWPGQLSARTVPRAR
jgi:hypothetical protein